MTAPDPSPLQVIAMHGWSGEASHWEPWRQVFDRQGWTWQSGERGYGGAAPRWPLWQPQGLRVVIAHSLGPHLLPATVLATAEAVVLLASFGRFVPPGPAGRRLRQALTTMERQLDHPETASAMLHSFLVQAAAPEPVTLLPPGPADRLLGEAERLRLREDLQLLGRCRGLPPGFPHGIPVLAVEAADDHIVVPEARELLRRDLEASRAQLHWLSLSGAGHCLLQPGVLAPVLAWLQTLLAP
ncbi:MAG: alpha/beta hydrolase [Synechococcus sp.]|nr:alpha/beta hydrolase [Synechococcus sp.]